MNYKYDYKEFKDYESQEDSFLMKLIEKFYTYLFDKEITNLTKKRALREVNIYRKLLTKFSIVLMFINSILLLLTMKLGGLMNSLRIVLFIIPLFLFIFSLSATRLFLNIEKNIKRKFEKRLYKILYYKYFAYRKEPYYKQMLEEMVDYTFTEFMTAFKKSGQKIMFMSEIQFITLTDEELSIVLFMAEAIRRLNYDYYVATHNFNQNSEALNFFNLKPNYTNEDLKKAYKQKIKECHPDNGGCEEDFIKVKNLYDSLI